MFHQANIFFVSTHHLPELDQRFDITGGCTHSVKAGIVKLLFNITLASTPIMCRQRIHIHHGFVKKLPER